MLRQIDELHGLLRQLYTGFLDTFRIADICNDGTVVVRVRLIVQQGAARRGPDLVYTGLNDLLVSSFRYIWNAFNNLCHDILLRFSLFLTASR